MSPKNLPIPVRGLAVAAIVLLALAPATPAISQDALSDRYRAIRAPAEIQANRTARQRVQSELNALARQENRLRTELRTTERLGYQDPVSSLPAAERALRRQIDRLGIDRRAAAAELGRLARDSEAVTARPLLSVGPADPDAPVDAGVSPRRDAVSTEAAVAAARAFVEDLLRANRERSGNLDPAP